MHPVVPLVLLPFLLGLVSGPSTPRRLPAQPPSALPGPARAGVAAGSQPCPLLGAGDVPTRVFRLDCAPPSPHLPGVPSACPPRPRPRGLSRSPRPRDAASPLTTRQSAPRALLQRTGLGRVPSPPPPPPGPSPHVSPAETRWWPEGARGDGGNPASRCLNPQRPGASLREGVRASAPGAAPHPRRHVHLGPPASGCTRTLPPRAPRALRSLSLPLAQRPRSSDRPTGRATARHARTPPRTEAPPSPPQPPRGQGLCTAGIPGASLHLQGHPAAPGLGAHCMIQKHSPGQ